MMIYEKSKRKKEEVKSTKKALQKTLYEYYNYPIVNCQYNQDLDQFSVYCFVDRNDDDAFIPMKFDYDEAIEWIYDVTVINHISNGTIV